MSSFVFKLKSKTGQIVVKELTPLSSVSELKSKLSLLTDIPENSLYVLCGFPPKPLDLSNNNDTIESCGIKSGDTLIVEQKQGASTPVERKNPSAKETEGTSSKPIPGRQHVTEEFQLNGPGVLMKQVVPADNSCLFTSIGFVMRGVIDLSCGAYMREIIAQSVANDSENYSEAILGKPNREYCEWIQKPDSWGGAIELAVMSHFYGLEIAVVDTLNAIINVFGEDKQYSQRVFLLFDGIHYDPLYLESESGEKVQTIFSTADERILQEATALAREAKASRQYTDLNHFTLRCMICDVKLTGQTGAQSHARETGHTNFGEIA